MKNHLRFNGLEAASPQPSKSSKNFFRDIWGGIGVFLGPVLPADPSSDHDKAVSGMEQAFVDLIKAGEAMKDEIAALKAQLKAVPFLGPEEVGKSTTAQFVEAAIQAAVSKKIIHHLHEAEIEEVIITCETFHEESDELIPQFERKVYDSARHAPSIYNFNGRSLDSHNPWHLERSFESYLDDEIEAEADLNNPRTPSVSKNPTNDNIGSIDSKFEVTKANSAFFEPSSRNKVADSIASNSPLNGEEGGNKLSPHFHSLEDSIVNKCGGDTEVPHGILNSMQRQSRALLAA